MKALYEKIAKARWQKEPGAASMSGDQVRSIRDILQAFESTASPTTRARRNRIDELLYDREMRHGHAVSANLPFGPANIAGLLVMDKAQIPGLVNRVQARSGSTTPVPPSAYGSIARAVANHELAEGVQLGNVITGVQPSSAHASHAGVLPLLAERMGITNPDAVHFVDQMRTIGREDAMTAKILRNHGQVGNYVLPFGGRAHRSAERQVASKIDPQLLPMAIQRAVSSGTPTDPREFLAHNSSLNTGGKWDRLSVRTKGWITSPKALALGAISVGLGLPLAYQYYKTRQAEQQPDLTKAAALTPAQVLGVYGAYLGGSSLTSGALIHLHKNQAKELGYLDERNDTPHAEWGVPLATAGLSYAGLHLAYPRMPTTIKTLGAMLGGALGTTAQQSGQAGTIVGSVRRAAANRVGQATQEGASFTNYLPTPTGWWGKSFARNYGVTGYNELLKRLAHKEELGWLDRRQHAQLQALAPSV